MTMRVLALLFALLAIACAPPLQTASAGDQADTPLHYCLSEPQARAAFLASNPQALAADVVARRVVILNQEGWSLIRVARASDSARCSVGERPFSAEELQATLNRVRYHPEISESCSVSFPASEDPLYGSRLNQFIGLSGVRPGSVNFGSDGATATVQDDCALVELLVRAIEAHVR